MGSFKMIVLDTHIWVWWVHDENKLSKSQLNAIEKNITNGIGISAISCWEIAKLVEYKRLVLPCSLIDWFKQALVYPGIRL
jgi:PIN domain nuclease of toxin-antitoxin system